LFFAGLFLLTRFQEALRRGLEPFDAVVDMLSASGHNIMVSGTTLAAAFLGLMLLPVQSLRGLGLTSGLAVIIVLAANLSLFPAMLLIFPNFFRQARDPLRLEDIRTFFRRRQVSRDTSSLSINTGTVYETSPLVANSSNLSDTVDTDEIIARSRWYRLAQIVTRFPFNVLTIVLVMGFSAPFAWKALGFPISGSVEMALDIWSPVTKAYNRLNDEFGYGYLDPYTLIIETDCDTPVLSEAYFLASRTVVRELVNALPDTNCSVVAGISVADCQDVPLGIVMQCLNSTTGGSLCAGLRDLYRRSVISSSDVEAAKFRILLDFDPIGPSGAEWYSDAVQKLKALESSVPHVKSLLLLGGSSWDTIHAALGSFPVDFRCFVLVVFISFVFADVDPVIRFRL
jgi:MMPL family